MSSTEIFWPNGRLKRRVEFKNGVRSGLDEIWSEEGVLLDSGTYKKGKPVGTHKRYDERGKILEEIYYDQKKTQEPLPSFVKINKAELPSTPKQSFDLFKKYPLISLLSRSWVAEKTSFESLEPFNIGFADAIYVFGIGGGAPYFQLEKWLHEKRERKLIIFEDNPGFLAHFLMQDHAHYLINDPQVFLEWNQEGLAEKYPFERIEIVSIPSKNGVQFQRFRKSLFQKTTLSHALYIEKLHGYQPFENFVKNLKYVADSFYANELKNAFQGFPAIVCGAGPSLQCAIHELKRLSKYALIIAGGSTLAALSSQGVPIHFGMAIDPNIEEYYRFKNSFAFDTPLIYSTRVHPSIFHTCNGPFGYLRSGIGGRLDRWIEEELGLRSPLLGATLSQESIAVTPIATAFAQMLGCNQILFCGVDLAYTRDTRYAEGVANEEKLKFDEMDSIKSVSDRIVRRKNHAGKMVYTATRWLMESASLADFATQHPEIQFFNTSNEGLPIRGVSYKPLDTFCYSKELIPPSFKTLKMPKNTSERVKKKLRELFESLDRLINFLEILSGNKKGSRVLAELDLYEELAYGLLFKDIQEILEKAPSEEKWLFFLDHAKKYHQISKDCKATSFFVKG